MRINRENYESYLVDYSEGVLSADLRQEVENFLLLNPDIKDEFEIFSSEFIEISEVSYPQKENLKKIPFDKTSVSSDYFQQLCIAHIEGLLPESDEKFLSALVKEDDQKLKELAAFEKTKLIIEKENFNEKILLKQGDLVHKVTDTNFEEYCIACMEGWLNQAGLVELNSYLAKNPDQKRVLDIYYKTRLTPDFTIVYPYKSKIKRFSILSPNFKKYISIASSVAAILVFSFMVYYTSTIDDKSQLSGNVSTPFVEKANETKLVSSAQKAVLDDESVKIIEPSVLHDPFGFEKISGKEPKSGSIRTEKQRYIIEPMQPIGFTQIECAPCKQIVDSKSLAKTTFEIEEIMLAEKEENAESNQNTNLENSEPTPAWVLAQAGIAGFNKITKSELKVEKNREQNKTKIAFNSKFFAFSTQVDNN